MNQWQRLKQSWRMTNNWNKLLVLLTAVIAISNGCYSCYARKQFIIMDGTLKEMKRSGQQSTEQVWRAIDNINWMARSMDLSQKGAQIAMQHSDQTAQQSLDASIAEAHEDRRPWVGIKGVPCDDCKWGDKSAVIHGFYVVLENTGKSPALSTTILMKIVMHKIIDGIPTYESIKAEPVGYTQAITALDKIIAHGPSDRELQHAKESLVKQQFLEHTPPPIALPPNSPWETDTRNVMYDFSVDIKDDMSEPKAIYLVGKISYKSPWKDKTHLTTFCVYTTFFTSGKFEFCPTGNDMN